MHHPEANRVRPYSEHTSDEWIWRLREKLNEDIDRIKSAQIIAAAIVNGRSGGMSKLSEATELLKFTHQQVEAKSEALVSRLVGLSEKIPGAFAKADHVIDSHNADVDQMENELNKLSNFPLEK